MVVLEGGSDAGALDVVSLGLAVPVEDAAGAESVGDGGMLPSVGVPEGVPAGVPEAVPVGVPVAVPVGEAVAVPGGTGGASSRIATISALNSSSWAEIWASEYAVMLCPNWVSRAQTSPRASSCFCPGVFSTDSTSWLAIAAVMHL